MDLNAVFFLFCKGFFPARAAERSLSVYGNQDPNVVSVLQEEILKQRLWLNLLQDGFTFSLQCGVVLFPSVSV